jgi:uncharacterized protein (TIGR03086 family)
MSTSSATVSDMTHTDTIPSTSTNSTASAAASSEVLEPGDPRGFFAHAVATARATIAGVGLDQFDLPTPCDAYDVRHLIGHLVAVMQRVAVVGAGGSPFEVPQEVIVADDAVVEAFTEAAHRVQEVWTADVLDRLVTVPWAQLPGRIVMAIYTSEVSAHTWDLATATGQTPDWHEPSIAFAYEAIRIGLPAEGRRAAVEAALEAMDEATRAEVAAEGAPFGEVVDVPADAPLIDRLVAWTGRDPRR